mgnify:CR=1 FL=1
MSAVKPDRRNGRDARHMTAVATSLGWADDAAERGDHADALGWVEMVMALGDELPDEYNTKREAWLRTLLAEADAVSAARGER